MPFNTIFSWLMKKRIHQIDLFRKYPEEVQSEVFHNLLSNGKLSTYGKDNNFHLVNDYDSFRDQVPLTDYDTLKPYIDRAMDGESNVLYPLETNWFAKSSGTSNDRSKYIPVTKESLENCHYKGGKDLLALYYENLPNRKLYNGKHLIIGGSAQLNPLNHESYQGDLSAIIVSNLPWWAEIRRTPSKEITLLSNWDEKLEKMAQNTIHEDIYIIAGVPSWTLTLCKRILEITQKENLHEVWPNLELFMHGGVSFEPYREEFKKLMPSSRMNFVETYNASEGFFGIQDQFDKNELLLMLDYGIFYEFIPITAYQGKDSKIVLGINEIELGVNYAVVITTNGGLWRYILGDTIAFCNKSPFRFTITGRTESYINVFGEELMVANTDKAIETASKMTKAFVKDYTACPKYMSSIESGRHDWLVEFSTLPNDLERFVNILDETLRSLNSDYDAKRFNNYILLKPSLTIAKEGLFDEWLKDKNKLGGQHKIPRLSNNRDLMEQLLQTSSNLMEKI